MTRQRVGIIITDLMGGDACYLVVSEEDYETAIAFNPTKKFKFTWEEEERDVLDPNKFQNMVGAYFYDREKDDDNEKVLEHFNTQTFCPENVDLSKYDVVGILTLPGG
jgi:hypothetical protein